MHVSGGVDVAGNQVNGTLAVNGSINISGGGQSQSVNINSSVASNKLVIDTTQHCGTSGNFVVDTQADSAGQSVSQAVRYTFTGCNTVTVAVAN
jgi:hypothetical protein